MGQETSGVLPLRRMLPSQQITIRVDLSSLITDQKFSFKELLYLILLTI